MENWRQSMLILETEAKENSDKTHEESSMRAGFL